MKPYEIFRRLSNSEIDAIVLVACEDDEIPDKIAGSVLSLQRVPLNRFERFPEDVRKGYVRKTLRDKRAEDLSLFVISAGLVGSKAEMIEAFLVALDLPHDGPSLTADGPVAEPPELLLKKAVADQVSAHGGRDVAIFLNAFVEQPDVSWPSLVAMLATDESLSLEDRSAS
ncbi:MAG: hypothetical protein IPL90_08140 [Holophagales bacterium]|nr:hypothetical protein [Holophagales bacterium]